MAVAGWVLDRSAASRAGDARIAAAISELAGRLCVCPVGELEQLHSARSARGYDALKEELHASFEVLAAPADILDRALRLQQDLAHHHGMWHRTPISDLLIAETALHHGIGVVHVDRIAEVRPLVARRLH